MNWEVIVKLSNGKLEFTKNDAIFLKQLILTTMSAKSMMDGKGPVTKFKGKEDYFFSHLHNMAFDLQKRRFEVTGPPHWYRNRYITRKATGKANEGLAQAEARIVEKANRLLQQQYQNAGVPEIEAYIQRQTGLSDEQMRTIKENFVPILRDVVGSNDI